MAANKKYKDNERNKIAVSLLGILSDEIIAEKTGLSTDEIRWLKKDN